MKDKLITIKTCTFSQAELIKTKLESEGIECYLENTNLIQPDIATGVKVRIKETDMIKSAKIINQISDNLDEFSKKEIKIKHIKKILLPIDFSDYSKIVCEFALGIAKQINAEIKLFHAYFTPVINTEPFDESYTYNLNIDKIFGNIEIEAKKNIKKFSNDLKNKIKKDNISGVKISYSLSCGKASTEIINMSEKYKPDIIILGSKGKGENINDIIGSVTAKIIENAKVPVLVIPDKFEYKGIDKIKNLMYATNFDKSDYNSIYKLINIISPFNIKTYCVHVGSDKQNLWNKVNMDKLNEHIIKRYKQYNIECDLIENEDILDGIEEYVTNKKIGIISLTTHKRNLFSKILKPSLAKKMVFHTNIPLLVFHT